MIDLPFTSQ